MHTYPEQEPGQFGRPLVGSLLFHAAIVGIVAFSGYLQFLRNKDTLGSLDASSQKFGEVTAVDTIPLPRRQTRPNPVANDTDTDLPKPKPKPKSIERPEPDAIAIKTKKDRKKEREKPVERASVQNREKEEPVRQNQMTSDSARALSSYLMGIKGAGGVGLTNNNPFGSKFGAYAALLQRIVAQKWQAQGINVKTGQPVLVTVEIQRDGNFRIVSVAQSSGNYSVDTGAKRALLDVNRFPQLPPDFDRGSAVVDFSFRVL